VYVRKLRRQSTRGMTGTMRDLGICQDCHTPARFLHPVCVAFCHAPCSNAHMWIHGLAQKIYRKRCCRRPHVPRGPSWSGRPRSSERKISQIGVFCSHRAVGYVPRSPRFPAKLCKKLYVFFRRYGIMKKKLRTTVHAWKESTL